MSHQAEQERFEQELKGHSRCEAIHCGVRVVLDRLAEAQAAREALQKCVEWYDSKPVNDTWQVMGTLSAAGHYLALYVSPEFGEWARQVWKDARKALAGRAPGGRPTLQEPRDA